MTTTMVATITGLCGVLVGLAAGVCVGVCLIPVHDADRDDRDDTDPYEDHRTPAEADADARTAAAEVNDPGPRGARTLDDRALISEPGRHAYDRP